MIRRTEFLRLFRKHIRRAMRIEGKDWMFTAAVKRLVIKQCPFLDTGWKFEYMRDRDVTNYEHAEDHFKEYANSFPLFTQMMRILKEERWG